VKSGQQHANLQLLLRNVASENRAAKVSTLHPASKELASDNYLVMKKDTPRLGCSTFVVVARLSGRPAVIEMLGRTEEHHLVTNKTPVSKIEMQEMKDSF
jgi:hypothetical protein